MTRDRMIQFAALGLMVVLIALSAWVTGPVSTQRRELQLDLGDQMGRSAPPGVVLANALGAFRGLAVDILWYRVNQMKEDGKLYEVNQLSEWITSMQPQFPQVWAFHAWNMAYNVSVMTYTPQERWDWVNKGIKLLREKGIFYNPRALLLYKELSWTFFHKIGQMSDDMHHYYKFQLALEWQQVLGEPPMSGTTEEVIEWFRPVAEAPDTQAQLIEQHPDVAPLIARLGEIGFDLDHGLVTSVGYLRMFGTSSQYRVVRGVEYNDTAAARDAALHELLVHPKMAPRFAPLMDYLRKKSLREVYNMQAPFMLELMEEFGPIDWRTPWAHSTYWTMYGFTMIENKPNLEGLDTRNTYRNAIHSMQAFTRFGRIAFEPRSGYLDAMPDPRFIASYERAMEIALEGEDENKYQAGHENLLLQVMGWAYFYGDREQAMRYYQKVRDTYGHKPHNQKRYLMTLDDLVMKELAENMEMESNTRAFVDAMILRALIEGLARSRLDVFERFIKLAKLAHTEFEKDAIPTPGAPKDRMSMGPFEEKLHGTYVSVMTSRRPVDLRVRVWHATPLKLRQQVYLRMRDPLDEQLAAIGISARRAFPPPEGIDPDAPVSDGSGPTRMHGVERKEQPAEIQRQ